MKKGCIGIRLFFYRIDGEAIGILKMVELVSTTIRFAD